MKGKSVLVVLLLLVGAAQSVSGLEVDCNQANAFDPGGCCCWIPDPTGGHAWGHVMDLGTEIGSTTIYFEIEPGAGDDNCYTTGYMYYSTDGIEWTQFWSAPNLQGWTIYSDTALVPEPFRYIRANTDGCSVDWSYVSILGSGNISVNSTPSGATIYLDDSDTGFFTNATIENVGCGQHEVDVMLEGYVSEGPQLVEVLIDQTVHVDFILNESENITVTSNLPGATIYLDSNETEYVTPATFAAPLGTHKVFVTHFGYVASPEQVVEVIKGSPPEIDLDFTQAIPNTVRRGEISLECEGTINGDHYGESSTFSRSSTGRGVLHVDGNHFTMEYVDPATIAFGTIEGTIGGKALDGHFTHYFFHDMQFLSSEGPMTGTLDNNTLSGTFSMGIQGGYGSTLDGAIVHGDGEGSYTLELEAGTPFVSFTYSPEIPIVNNAISFDGSYSSYPASPIREYRWDFGDGSYGTGQTTTHTYSAAGMYPVILTIITEDVSEFIAVHYLNVFSSWNNAYAIGMFAGVVYTDGNYDSHFAYPFPVEDGFAHFSPTSFSGHFRQVISEDEFSRSIISAQGCGSIEGNALDGYFRGAITEAYYDEETHSWISTSFYHSAPGCGALLWDSGYIVAPLRKTVYFTDPDGHLHSTTIIGKGLGIKFFGDPLPGPPEVEFPVAEFSYAPEQPTIGAPIAFDGGLSYDPDGEIISYQWNFGDGTWSEGREVEYTYTYPGDYTVTLAVIDYDGYISETEKILHVKGGPGFTFSPEKIRPQDMVTFTANVTLPDIQYDWNFGDGTILKDRGPQVTHAFTNAGTYQVLLTTTDEEGSLGSIGELNVTIPVYLVHGFQDDAETCWGTLASRLREDGCQVFNFDYGTTSGFIDPREVARWLKADIDFRRNDLSYNGQEYTGKYDIVCHSMGALVTRWYMEELGGGKNVRQWIGVAPVNHGAATADFAEMAPDAVKFLIRAFTKDSIFFLKTDSPVVRELERNVPYPGVTYRVIMGYNGYQDPLFFLDGAFRGLFGGKTWAMIRLNGIPTYYLTWLGDGIVANEQSTLYWAGTDSLCGYDHFMTNKPLVISLVTSYIKDINRPSTNIIPSEEEFAQQHYINNLGTFWEGQLKRFGEKVILAVLISAGDPGALIRINWLGSDVNMTLISPTGERVGPDSDKVAEYVKTNNTIYYLLIDPEPGEWSAEIDPVDIPESGEPVTFSTFFSSAVTFTAEPAQPPYSVGQMLPIRVHVMNGYSPITGASVIAYVSMPDNTTRSITLLDDGTGGDTTPGDGTYSADMKMAQVGLYSVRITTTGTTENPLGRTTFLSAYASDLPGSHLHLYTGWNFISVPKSLDDGSKTARIVFSGVDTQGNPVWAYDNGGDGWTQVDETTVLIPLEGYWVYSADVQDVPVYYRTSPGSMPFKALSQGWNAIGTGSLSPLSTTVALNTVSDSWTFLLRFDNGLQMYMPPIVNGQDAGEMVPGQGYWIYMNEEGTLVGFG